LNREILREMDVLITFDFPTRRGLSIGRTNAFCYTDKMAGDVHRAISRLGKFSLAYYRSLKFKLEIHESRSVSRARISRIRSFRVAIIVALSIL